MILGIRRFGELSRRRDNVELVGERITNDSVIGAHPDLMPELAEGLEFLKLLEVASAKAEDHQGTEELSADKSREREYLSVRCPYCHSSLRIQADGILSGIECRSCRHRFNLATDQQVPSSDAICTLGHLVQLERIGKGSYGVVWKARDTELDRIVAVKIPRQRHDENTHSENLLREARTVAQLNHPNIVTFVRSRP